MTRPSHTVAQLVRQLEELADGDPFRFNTLRRAFDDIAAARERAMQRDLPQEARRAGL